jgi:hypothetical protein
MANDLGGESRQSEPRICFYSQCGMAEECQCSAKCCGIGSQLRPETRGSGGKREEALASKATRG